VSREAPYAADLPFPKTLIPASPTMHTAEVVDVIRSFRPTRVAFHEFADLARDVRAAKSWRHRLGYVFRGPGWSPDGSGGGSRG